MIYLCVLFVPPLYFLIRSRWGNCVVNSMFYLMACFFVITLIGIPFGVFLWAVSVGHAAWNLRLELVEQMMTRQAELIAHKMAAQFQPRGVVPSYSPAPDFCANCGHRLIFAGASCPVCEPTTAPPVQQLLS